MSVVIPCFNYAEYVEEAVDSALSQRGVAVDVTIIDDASQDGSPRVIAALASRHRQVNVVAHPRNLGHLKTANEALSRATAPYLVKLDADDLLSPGSLARSVALLDAHPEVGFVYGWPVEFRGDVPLVADGDPQSWTIWSGEEWLLRVLRRAHNVIMQPEVMIRRSALIDVGGGYSEQLRLAEDHHLWMRLASRWAVGRINGSVQGLYRVHEKSLQRSADDLHLNDLRARAEATRLFIATSPEVDASLARHAITSLARDTRRLLATRRNDTSTAHDVVDEYIAIVESLEAEASVRASRGPMTWDGSVGRRSRQVFEAIRWRRWRATGI